MIYVEQFTKFLVNALGGKDNVRNEFLSWDNFFGDISYILISSMQYAFASGIIFVYLYNHLEIFYNFQELLLAALTPQFGLSLVAIGAFLNITGYQNKINSLITDTVIFIENHIRLHAVSSTFIGAISQILRPNVVPILNTIGTGLYSVFAVIASLSPKTVSKSIYKTLQFFGFVRKNDSPPDMLVSKDPANQEESFNSIMAQTTGAVGGVALASYFPFANNIIFSSLTAAAGAKVALAINNSLTIEDKNSVNRISLTNK